MLKPARKIYDWAAKKAYSPHASKWLALIFLLEVVLVLPLDAILMMFCWENPKKRFLYAGMAAFGSLISGLIGYYVGFWVWDQIGPFLLNYVISPSFFEKICSHYNNYKELALFLGSLLPVPFKVIALSAGVCKISLSVFLLWVLVARTIRFFVIAQLMEWWGSRIKGFVDKNFNHVVMAVGAKIAIGLAFFWALGQ